MENGLPWDRATVGDLFDELDRDGSGRITRDEWFRFCDRNPRVARQLGTTAHGSVGLRHNDNQSQVASWDRLSKGGSFARRSDIQELLMENGLPWDRATVGDLFDELDRDGSGRISRDEWFRFCDRNPHVARQLGTTVHGSAGLRHNDADATWDRLSKGGSFARRSDIQELLMENGLPWDRATVGDLFDELDRDGSGRITRDEWLRFCAHNPSVARRLDAGRGSPPARVRRSEVDSTWGHLSRGSAFASGRDIRALLAEAGSPPAGLGGREELSHGEWMQFCSENPAAARRMHQLLLGVSPLKTGGSGGGAERVWDTLSKGTGGVLRSDAVSYLRGAGMPSRNLEDGGSVMVTRGEWLDAWGDEPGSLADTRRSLQFSPAGGGGLPHAGVPEGLWLHLLGSDEPAAGASELLGLLQRGFSDGGSRTAFPPSLRAFLAHAGAAVTKEAWLAFFSTRTDLAHSLWQRLVPEQEKPGITSWVALTVSQGRGASSLPFAVVQASLTQLGFDAAAAGLAPPYVTLRDWLQFSRRNPNIVSLLLDHLSARGLEPQLSRQLSTSRRPLYTSPY
ncbi:hypothetical protein DIPPA_24939 [Diplonema papillatum]|nr:hypothetical protein DIPPA_24939 [Diplonema papillatum]